MGGSHHFFPWEYHGEDLSVIKGIHFTPREIDTIACLMNARGTRKVSFLLSVSPNTVFTHTRHIMAKLGCNSREGIIDFIEGSQKLSVMKGRYRGLVIHAAFEKGLKAIGKEKTKESHPSQEICLILCGKNLENLKTLHLYLSIHLKQARLSVKIENVAPPHEIKERKEDDQVIALFLDNDEGEKFSQKPYNATCLNVRDYENYYFLVLAILKRLCPALNTTKHFQSFIEQCQEKKELPERINEKETPLTEKYVFKRKALFFACAILFALSACYTIFIFQGSNIMPLMQGQEGLGAFSIHSDLSLPTPAVLLERPEDMAQIDEKLQEKEGIQSLVLVGPGGIGKTTLARQYAQSQKAKVLWEVNAETKESLLSSFEDLAEALAITEKDQKILIGLQEIKEAQEKEKKLLQFVKRRLKDSSPWFLLYDNIETLQTIQPYFPKNAKTWGDGKVIITTRNSQIQANQYVKAITPLKELTPLQKLALFTKIITQGQFARVSTEKQEKAAEFLTHIPSFPLDVSIAAYYLNAANISYDTYLERLQRNSESLAEIQELVLKEAGDYVKTRYGIISLSIQHLLNTHKDFGPLLLFVSLLDSQQIPRSLLDHYQQDELIVDHFLIALKRYSLAGAERNAKTSFFSMHHNTQDICLTYLTKILKLQTNKKTLDQIVKSLESYIASFIEKEDLVKLRLLLSHCKKFLSHENLITASMRKTITNEQAGIQLYLGNYLDAKHLLEGSLSDPNLQNLSQARALTYLGNAYGDLGHYQQAIHVLEKSLEIYKKRLSTHHTEKARALACLGNVYRDLGDFEKAKNFLEQSHAIYQKAPSKNDISHALVSAYLGITYTILGSHEKAKALLEESLATYKKDPLRNGVGVAWILAHLGEIYDRQKDHEKAKSMYEEAITLYKAHFPEGHIKTGWALSMLGEIYRTLKKYDKAKEALEQSFAIYKKHLPDNQVVLAGLFVYLGAIHRDLGEHEQAKDLLEKSLHLYKKHVPEDHVEIAWALAHLGETLRAMNNNKHAKTLLEKSIKLYQKHFTADHVEVTWAKSCLEKVNQKLGERGGAKIKKSLNKKEAQKGSKADALSK